MVFLEKFVAETLGLAKFPPFLPTFYAAFLGFTLLHLVIAPYVSARWFPVAYGGKGRAAKNNWSIHVVSQAHVLVVVPYALYCIVTQAPVYGEDRAFGWDDSVGHVHAIAAGYFLWDTLDAIFNFIDPGFVAHGVACFAIYTMSYKPFLAYYGTRCLLWETSTFFLNIHWFMDKTGRTGTRAQLVNGALLVSSFFFVRIVYGGWVSVQFFITLVRYRSRIPLLYALVYGMGNFVLQGLNIFWFYKMIMSLRKRFDKKDVTANEEEGTRLVGDAEAQSQGAEAETQPLLANDC